mgnify:CR=1 FL=1
MYCVNCGVKLSDTEKRCPLCQTLVYHPEVSRHTAEPLYPEELGPALQLTSWAAQFIITTAYLLAMSVCLVCDLQLGGGLTWSGYVIGALILCYLFFLLPAWFRKPNPVIFVPCGFAALAVYLLYIDLAVQGNWFWTLALPVSAGVCLIVTAVVALNYSEASLAQNLTNQIFFLKQRPGTELMGFILLAGRIPALGAESRACGGGHAAVAAFFIHKQPHYSSR